jgi:Fe-S cluster assembly protein SufD
VPGDTAPYLHAFQALRPSEPRWLSEKREAAIRRFSELGFPTRRQEAWRFTDLRPLQRAVFPPATTGAAPRLDDAHRLSGATHRIVLVNGRFAPNLSDLGELPKGAWLASTARTLAERPALLEAIIDDTDMRGAQSFASLNAALFADGFVLALDPGIALDRPVEIIHFGEAAQPHSLHLRSAVLLASGSRAQLIESFAGTGSYWTNAVMTVGLSADAVLHHAKLQDEAAGAIHFAVTRAVLDRGARYESFVLTLGARLSRHDTFATLAGEQAQCGVSGAFLLRGEQESTNATFVDHLAPGGTTREVWKGVVEDRAHGVFLGRIAVRPEAQKTDAHQLNRNLLLSPRATVDTKPELEILADDVKCSHGATVGDLDENALFYLRARGIPEAEARHMLIEAFAADAIATVEPPALRDYLTSHLQRWLGRSRS